MGWGPRGGRRVGRSRRVVSGRGGAGAPLGGEARVPRRGAVVVAAFRRPWEAGAGVLVPFGGRCRVGGRERGYLQLATRELMCRVGGSTGF